MKKVMVLGAGGWLGERLVESLVAAGREVICVDVRLGPSIRAMRGVEVIEADIRATDRFAGRLDECATVFNCAGVLHPKKTRDIYAINCDSPVAVYQECVRRGVGTFVHISSINAEGPNETPTTFLDETAPNRPITHYGRSKAQSEVALRSLVAEGSTRLIMLRPAVFYGERPSKNLRELLTKIKTSPLPLFAPYGFLRSYVDVDKVVEAMLLAEHHGGSGEAYLIGDEEPLSTLRFYQILADELGCPAKVIRIPLFVARSCEKIALMAGNMNIHLRIPTIVGEFGRHTYYAFAKAKSELGFLPHRSSEEGLRRMVRSVKID